MQDDDFSLFTNEMRGVKRISVDQADTGKPKPDRQQLNERRQNATVRNEAIKVDGLSGGEQQVGRARAQHTHRSLEA